MPKQKRTITKSKPPQWASETIVRVSPNWAHREMVNALNKPGAAIKKALTPAQAHLLHMSVGISGEAGELLDTVKKHCIYQKPLDMENVVEELGDLEYFLQGLREALLIKRDDTLRHNIRKLSKRYHEGKYSDAQAQQRADKAGDK
jgi:NTP pyrophosphatase (non-canonical NTP hydrolase)